MEINLSNSKDRDATVTIKNVSRTLRVRWVDSQKRQCVNKKILKGTLDRDFRALSDRYKDDDALVQALIEEDPEIDFENYGMFLEDVSRVYINAEREVVHKITHWEIVKDPQGNEKVKRPRRLAEPNVSSQEPLKWTGKLMSREDVCRRFVFSHQVQIVHHNGLTYDFLYGMAKELAEKDSVMLLGGGPKGTQPLIFRRGGTPYRGFLEGRVSGAMYALILHLSNMELKKPTESEGEKA